MRSVIRLDTVINRPWEVPLFRQMPQLSEWSHSIAITYGVLLSLFFVPVGTKRRSIKSRVCNFFSPQRQNKELLPTYRSDISRRAQQCLILSYNLTSTEVVHSELQSDEHSSGSLWATISRGQQRLILSYNLTFTAEASCGLGWAGMCWRRILDAIRKHWATFRLQLLVI